MNKKDIAWFIKQAHLAEKYIIGNKDQERFLKLLKQAQRELAKASG